LNTQLLLQQIRDGIAKQVANAADQPSPQLHVQLIVDGIAAAVLSPSLPANGFVSIALGSDWAATFLPGNASPSLGSTKLLCPHCGKGVTVDLRP
jgi:hypothetical protein